MSITDQTTARTSDQTVNCPPWCTAKEHPWENGSDGWPIRDHEASFNVDDVGIYAHVEEKLTPHGLTLGEPKVGLSAGSSSEDLDPSQAGRVIEALTAALAVLGAPHRPTADVSARR